jgi:hypothetical protein
LSAWRLLNQTKLRQLSDESMLQIIEWERFRVGKDTQLPTGRKNSIRPFLKSCP